MALRVARGLLRLWLVLSVLWIGEQCGAQSALHGACFGRESQLWARQIGFQKFVGDQQPAVGIAIRQMMAAGEPKILHSRFPCASFAKSTGSVRGSFIDAVRRF